MADACGRQTKQDKMRNRAKLVGSCIFISMIVNSKEKILMDLLSEKGGRITAKEASLAGIHRMFSVYYYGIR